MKPIDRDIELQLRRIAAAKANLQQHPCDVIGIDILHDERNHLRQLIAEKAGGVAFSWAMAALFCAAFASYAIFGGADTGSFGTLLYIIAVVAIAGVALAVDRFVKSTLEPKLLQNYRDELRD